MQRKSLTGKVKNDSNERENSSLTLSTIAGKISCFFSRKKEDSNENLEVINDMPEAQVCYLKHFKVLEMADLEYIFILIDSGYVVVSDLTKLDPRTRRCFVSELKIRLWGNGKSFFEINHTNIICGNLSINKYQRNEEIIRRK